MRLEDYWGIGPKTRALLAERPGVEAAIAAIESADVRALTDAGLPRGRATRILRHAHGGEAMGLLATRDARDVYKQLLDLMGEFAVTGDLRGTFVRHAARETGVDVARVREAMPADATDARDFVGERAVQRTLADARWQA